MASYTLTIHNVPQENNNIELSYNSNDGRSTESTIIGNSTWTYTLQSLSYSKAIYKPGELIFKLQITGCSGVNAIYSTFKGKKIELKAQADNKSSSIAKDYYIFGIQIEKKGNVYYATFQAYDPFKFLTLDTYCKAYTGKKFIQDIFLNKELWPNNITDKNLKGISIEDIDATHKKIKELNEQIEKETDTEKKKELEKQRNEEEENLVVKKGQFIIIPKAKYLTYKMGSETKEFIQPYLVQYNESFFDFLVRVSNRCGEFLYYEDGYFNIGWEKKTKKDKDDKEQDDITPITEYVSVNFSDETATAWKENYIVSSHHNYPLINKDNRIKRYPTLLPLDEEKLQTEYGKGYNVEEKGGGKIDITGTDQSGTPITIKDKSRSDYEVNVADLQCQDSYLASDENLASLPPKDKYTKWGDFALWPGCYLINVFTDIVNSANIAEAIANVTFSTFATSMSSLALAADANNNYETEYFNNENDIYKKERKNGDHIHPFSTSEENKNTTLSSYVTFSLEFYETVRKGIETNERSRIQIALGDHFYPLTLGSLIELDGEKYIVVQMNGCANSGTETLDIEVIPYKENEFVFPPAAPVGPIREAKAQRAFITHNTDPLKMNRVRVRYPWQGQTEDPTPWIRIALPMASDGSGFNFLPQIGDEAIINYENGNIEKPYVEGMLYTRAAEEDESTVPYAFKQDKARVISSVNGHSIIFSDPPASTNVFNGLIPLWKTINSFYPTVLKGKLPDYNKKAMGGIEFTDEHGLYSISMSSDKRAISIDSPLGKVDINAFTGITISAPNGNVRIEGKNIDIVAGNNLSISSGNNIASHFWHMKDKKWKEGWKDFGKTIVTDVLSKIEVIDMNLIRTAFETIVRPCGGTMLIKSNRYLCFEAGKGEAQIAGRQTVKQLGLRNTFKHLKPDLFETTIQYNPNNPNPVATNRIPIHINNVIQAIEAAKKAFDTINANMLSAKDAYSDAYSKYHAAATALTNQYVNTIPQDFASLYPNNIDSFNAVQMQNKPQPHKLYALERYKEIKTYVNVLNENALYIKDMHLTSDKIWADFKNVYLQDTVVSQLINTQIIETSLKNLFDNSTTQNYLSNNGPQDLGVNLKRALVYEILNLLINNQTTTETQDSTHCSVNKISLGQQIQAYDNTQWGNLINNNLAYENGAPDQLRKRDNARLGIMKSKFLGLHKLDGMLDQYIWDTNEDAGKILFSDQEGETLNFQNKEIHYYKKSETDPLAKLKQILRSIQ
ncbi:phage baseplate assembly protein V [Phocaeicola coprophilus]|uniref:phage baseplate assembly protein V n=1 Tax=Phocaeicola coprophilus TaxID=387090 RepID=UPI001E08D92A|nr:phage baseplate assembly protein V [Phocaeicola coprophilus]HJE46951.1 phage baseplate assembly protein V [Phocaeicola coprophilus]